MNLIMILFVLVEIYYFSFFIFRILKEFTKVKLTKHLKIIIIALLALLGTNLLNMYRIQTNICLHLMVVSLVYELIFLLIKKNKVYRFLLYSGILTITTVTAIFAYGYYNINNVIKTEYIIKSDKIDNFQILQVSDLHMGNAVNLEKLEKYVKEINKLNPDIVVLTGDIVDESTTLKEMESAIKLLGQLNNKQGIYYIYGNHDENNYSRKREYDTETLNKALENNGIIILKDEHVVIDNVTLIGRIDPRRDGNIRKTTKELLENIDKNTYMVLLDHRPIEYKENAELGIDLQISGHTHGGQYFPSGPIEALTTRRPVHGTMKIDSFTLLVSSGISGWGYPFKTGAPSEYVLINIE